MAVINWAAHGKAMQRHLNKRTVLVKLVHGLLPTNLKLHLSDPKRNKCPSCQTHAESWQHIMCCHSDPHASWRASLIQMVDSKCKALGTMPSLHTLLIQALREWFSHPHDENAYQLQTQNATPSVRRIIFQQNAIGWEPLFMGRFSSEWGSLQDEFYARQSRETETKRYTGQRWQIAIIRSIWQHWFLLWALRNKALHGADARSQAQAERKLVERTLIDIYDMRTQMEPSVQRLLHRDLTDHFSKTVAYNKNWLAFHGPLVRQSIKRAKEKAIQGVKSIKHYFGTLR